MNLTNKNRSKVLFNEIERQEEARVRAAAGKVAKTVSDANERLDRAEREYNRAAKSVKKIKQALKQYKKTGDLDCLKKLGA